MHVTFYQRDEYVAAETQTYWWVILWALLLIDAPTTCRLEGALSDADHLQHPLALLGWGSSQDLSGCVLADKDEMLLSACWEEK